MTDAVGGVRVYAEEPNDASGNGGTAIKKGWNDLNGTQALAFVIETIFNIFILTALVRFWMQVLRAPARNPLAQFTMALTDFAVKPMRRLLPGMAVTAALEVGQRKVVSYFLYPILKGLDTAIREP